MVVTVAAGLLVVEAQSVQQLVLDSVVVQTTPTAQRHNLLATATANVGVAPDVWRQRKVIRSKL